MLFRPFAWCLIWLMGLFMADSMANEQINFGVVGKTKRDSFYEQSLHGCEHYADSLKAEGVKLVCHYGGPEYFQDIREQAMSINELIDAGVDGLLVSTTDSHYLVKNALERAKQANIPVVTFDSDLLPEDQDYRLAYVGTNNFDFGVALGEAAKTFKTQASTLVCIQSGHESTPNLDERIQGVRYALSNGTSRGRLTGEHGWSEYERCPFYSLGKRDMSVSQLELSLKRSVPMFIAVAGFAQFSPSYVERISPYKEKIASNQLVIVSADTESVQLDVLKLGLSTVNIGQRPYDMGRIGAELLYTFVTTGQRPQQEFTYLGFHTCTSLNASNCTTND